MCSSSALLARLGSDMPALPLSHLPWHQTLVGGFTTALVALLLLGTDSSTAQAHAALALRKCGAGDLVGEARALAAQLSRFAAVTEAVAAPWYQALSSDLL